MTWKEWIANASEALRGAGVNHPHAETRAIVRAVIDPSLRQYDSSSELIGSEVLILLNHVLNARCARQPLSQIIGWRDFWKHRFRITCDTLDPRQDTETLVEVALQFNWLNVLDLGTGSGAVLISLLAARPGTSGLGVDISERALSVARLNGKRIGVDAEFIRTDWFNGVSGLFDLIVSNPPYISLKEMTNLQPEVRDWEPDIALTDFADGLSAYRVIAQNAREYLNPDGQVLVEIGWQQGQEVQEIFKKYGAEVKIFRDLDGRDRVVHARF